LCRALPLAKLKRFSWPRNGRDKVSKLGTYDETASVDFRAVGSFEETIWTMGEAIAALVSREETGKDHRQPDNLPMATRRSVYSALFDKSDNNQI